VSLRSTPTVSGPKTYDPIRTGRAFEAERKLDDAIDAYLRGGAHREAARLLSFGGKFAEAAEALLQGLPKEPTPPSHLTADERRDALNAALCFARGGARVECISLLVNLGETERAAALLQSTGRRAEAVEAMKGNVPDGSPWPKGLIFPVTERLKLPAKRPPSVVTLPPEALEVLPDPQSVDASMPPDPMSLSLRFRSPEIEEAPEDSYEPLAGPVDEGAPWDEEEPTVFAPTFEYQAMPSGPMPSADLAGLLTATADEDRYGGAVSAVVQHVWRDQRMSRRVALFLDEFVRRAANAQVPEELRAAVYAVGRLFEFHDRLDAAQKAYRAVVLEGPEFADASYRLGNLQSGLAEAADGCWHPVQLLIAGVHPFGNLPSLADLPPLDGTAIEASGSFPMAQPPRVRPVPAAGPDSPFVVTDSMRRLKPGAVIAGRYRIEEPIGTGGMATVYRATDTELEETVALKLFRSAGQSEDGLARFRREMKLSRRLNHPNIVHIYEFGTWHGLHFITMELLEGLDLADLAERKPRGRVPHDEVVRLMIQACEGLAFAHAEGVVHRDVKPQNFFVQDDGVLKVMDFGIAKAQSSATISVTGVRLGTPRYMSPEQIEGGKHVGPSADLYGLGVVMYELITGIPPFSGETLVKLLLAHISEPPKPPRELVSDLPMDVEKVVLRLLAKSPEHRYADCAETKAALEACLSG